MASSQGLYELSLSGQLSLVNTTTGKRSPIGAPLTTSGWVMPADGCSPTAVDTTGKWIYTWARNATAVAAAAATAAVTPPWWVLGVELLSGMVRKAYPLPAVFPPDLPACAHAIAADSGWHAYVALITRDTSPRLVTYRFTFTWPYSNEVVSIVDADVGELVFGAAVDTPSAAVTNTTLWLRMLTDGILGVDLVTQAPSRRLPVPAARGVPLGLQYDTFGARRVTYVPLVVGGGDPAVLAYYEDAGTGTPELVVPDGAVTYAAPAHPCYAALAGDLRNMTVVTRLGSLLSVRLADSVTMEQVDGWCLPVTAMGADQGAAIPCPLFVAYEPLVF